MAFQRSRCIVRQVYCGNSKKLPKDTATKKYSRKGSSYECLRRGYGIAQWTVKSQGLSVNSLQRIKYIGPVFEKNFKRRKVYSTKSLITRFQPLTAANKRKLLTAICTRSNNTVDYRAFNSVVLYLYDHGVRRLPTCRIVKE